MAADWLAPVLGLAGTASATAVGLYQWKKADKRSQAARYTTRRAEVMEALVQKLQQLQLLSRAQTISIEEMETQTRGLNQFLIENRLWLEVADGELAREYVRVLRKIHEAIRENPDQLDLFIGTSPGNVYDESVAQLFVRLGQAEKKLVARTRRAMRT